MTFEKWWKGTAASTCKDFDAVEMTIAHEYSKAAWQAAQTEVLRQAIIIAAASVIHSDFPRCIKTVDDIVQRLKELKGGDTDG